MEPKDIISGVSVLISTLLIVLGWLFIRFKDREQEKFKIRHSRREDFVKAFLSVDEVLRITQGKTEEDENFMRYWLEFVSLAKLYGTVDENRNLEEFAVNFFESRDLVKANNSLNRLRNELIASVRAELGFK